MSKKWKENPKTFRINPCKSLHAEEWNKKHYCGFMFAEGGNETAREKRYPCKSGCFCGWRRAGGGRFRNGACRGSAVSEERGGHLDGQQAANSPAPPPLPPDVSDCTAQQRLSDGMVFLQLLLTTERVLVKVWVWVWVWLRLMENIIPLSQKVSFLHFFVSNLDWVWFPGWWKSPRGNPLKRSNTKTQ